MIDPQCLAFFMEQRAFMKRTDDALQGDGSDGKPGLRLRVDRNAQSIAANNKWKWIVIALATAALFKATF
jgi:hypothetical protein